MLDLLSIINLTGNRSQYIKAREKLAEHMLKNMHGRIFLYTIPEISNDIGYCTINHITYDRLIDSFIYVIKDCNSQSVFITERCNLRLVEVFVEI